MRYKSNKDMNIDSLASSHQDLNQIKEQPKDQKKQIKDQRPSSNIHFK